MSQPNFTEKLTDYIHSGCACVFIQTSEEVRLDALLAQLAETEGFHILEWNLGYGWVNPQNKQPLPGNDINQLVTLSQSLPSLRDEDLDNKLIVIKNAKSALVEDQHARARLQQLINRIHRNHEGLSAVLIISEFMQLPQEIEAGTQILPLPLPSRDDIGKQIDHLASQYGLQFEDEQRTAVCNACAGLTLLQIRQVILRIKKKHSSFDRDAITAILHEKENLISKSGMLEMVKVNESIDDLGGLEELKEWLRERAALIRQIEKLESINIAAPKGVLLAGMPGCGKSLAAKAAANLFQLPLLRLDMGSLLGKYVGESESNMRRALATAESISPCILWIDELEKAFAQTSNGGGASEVTSRLLGYFLTWMQDKPGTVFVFATANDITALPPELLRKGRFDEVFYVGFPNQQEREAILRVRLQKSQQNLDELDLIALAAVCRDYCGADIHNAVNLALEKTVLGSCQYVSQDNLRAAIAATVPLSQSQYDKIQSYETLFEQLKLRSASRQIGESLAQMKKWIDDPNHLRRRKLAEHPDCPESIHEKLILDIEESVIEAVLKNPCCTEKILALVITQCCPAEVNQEISAAQIKLRDKALKLAARHPNIPLDLVEVMLQEKRLNPTLNFWWGIQSNSSITVELRDRLLQSSPELQILESNNERLLKRAVLAEKEYICQDVQNILAKDNEYIVRKSIATNPIISADTQKILLSDNVEIVRSELAKNTNLKQSTQSLLTKDKERYVRESLAANLTISEETQHILVNDLEEYVRSELAKNTRLTQSTQSLLTKDKARYVRESLAANLTISEETQHILVNDLEEYVRSELAKNTRLTQSTQSLLTKDKERYVRESLAANLTISEETQHILVNDLEEYVRSELAKNTRLTQSTQEILTKDREEYVRSSLACNPTISFNNQNVLAADSDDRVRASLARNTEITKEIQLVLIKNSESNVRESLAQNVNCLPELQNLLVKDECKGVRSYLAENPNCLHVLQGVLVNDPDKDVREALARNKKCALEFQITLLNDCSQTNRYRIARQATDSLALQSILAKDDNSDVRLALAQNHKCLHAIQAILVHDNDSDIREALAANPNISEETRYILANDVKKYVRTALYSNHNVSPEILKYDYITEALYYTHTQLMMSFGDEPELTKEEQNILASDSPSSLRESLARDTRYHETQNILAKDNRNSVIQALADNPHLSQEVKNILSKKYDWVTF
ncbi:AAA family ATPase [Shewanella sp. LC6]|uniref:AAA family ATPase n=1 Tax=unclassified Shewanella TaxID=196818 RepID=UPI0011271195|nr:MULTISPECIES: AAA family ATPase [unclassified Shewanella]QQK58804.1 AAA family ATPase [Shewanella sp. LC6]TPE50630.1 AAA family ATPase [Shewanella sp. LC2]